MPTLVAKLWVGVGADTREAETKLGGFSNTLRGYGEKLAKVGQQMSLFMTVPLAAAGKKAISLASDYGQAMSILQATTQASGTDMKKLDELAQELGADLSLPATSASDAAEAMLELSKSGLSVNQVLKASRGVLQLSVAGQLSNARAAEIASNALNMFKLSGDQAVRVADLLAAGANKSSAEVTDMADALQMSGSVFAAANIPIEDLVTSISEMANAGIKGSDAGTSLKQMLLSLQAPSAKAKELMENLGISIYDAEGNLRPMHDLVGTFTSALGGLTQEQRNAALATIFGSDAVRAANIVMMGGVTAFEDMKTAVTEEGAAAELAAARMTGLAGSLGAMQSALETAALAAGNAAAGPVTLLAEKVTDAAIAFSELSPEVQDGWVNVAMGAALLGPSLGVLGKLTVAFSGLPAVIGAAGTALAAWRSGLTLTTALGAAGLSPLAISLGVVAAAAGAVVGVWAAWNKNITQTNESGQKAVQSAWGDFFKKQVESGKSAAEVLAAYRKAQDQVNKTLDDAGIIKVFIADQEKLKNDVAGLNAALAASATSYEEYLSVVQSTGEFGIIPFSRATWEAAHAQNALSQSALDTASTIPTLEESTAATAAAYEEQARAAAEAEAAQQAVFAEIVRGASATKNGLGEMINQYDNLKGKMDAWLNETAGQVVSMLGDKFSEASQKYRSALGEVDTILGSNYLKQLEQKDAVQKVVDEYGKTGNLDAFRDGLQKIKDEGLADMQTQLEEVTTKAGLLYDKLLALPEEIRIHIGFDVDQMPSWVEGGWSPAPPTGDNGARPWGGEVSDNFAGGVTDFVVPPGYPNDSYRVGLTSGEHVTVTPDGKGQGITIESMTLVSSATNADELFREFINRLAQEQRGQANAGAVYAGR